MYNNMEWYMKLCEYGCGGEAKFTLKNGKQVCSKYSTQCPTNKNKNTDGLKKAYSDGRIKCVFESNDEYRRRSVESRISNIQSNSFETWGKKLRYAKVNEDQNNSCLICGISEWNGKPITLELDHIDGDSSNNVRDNVRLLCPNCHSQTDNWRGRNINKGTKKVSDEELLESLLESKSIHTALMKVKLAPKGGNYKRASKLLEKYKSSNVMTGG
jgi:hypothetical protein